MNLSRLYQQAQESKYHRFLLEQGLSRFVPFNRSHRFKVAAIEKYKLHIVAPYRRSNLNHLKGVHACAMATIAEISSGLLLIGNLDPKRFRIILQNLNLEYHYQAKSATTARFEIDENWMNKKVMQGLSNSDKVFVDCNIELYDSEENKVATAIARWQIKDWKSVKTKV